jgi:hypothetical protein
LADAAATGHKIATGWHGSGKSTAPEATTAANGHSTATTAAGKAASPTTAEMRGTATATTAAATSAPATPSTGCVGRCRKRGSHCQRHSNGKQGSFHGILLVQLDICP